MRRPYYIFSNGRLRRRDNTLFLQRADDNRSPGDDSGDSGLPSAALNGEKVSFPVEQVESLYCFGEIDVNSKLVTFLAQHSTPLFFFDFYGNYTAALYPRDYLISGRLKVDQVLHYARPRRRLRLARAIVEAGTYNILRVLRYYSSRTSGDVAAQILAACECIEQERDRIEVVVDIPELMGTEGRIRDVYYRCWPALLGDAGRTFPFERRERRPPSNELNALISFGNALCYSAVLRQIYRTALDPAISYLHEPGERRFSLALDLSEIFKPLLVDRGLFRLIKTGAIQPKHFEERLGGMYLNDSGRRIVVEHWDDRLRRTIEHRRLNRRVSYERLIRLECYRLVRHLCDPKADPYRGFKMWW